MRKRTTVAAVLFAACSFAQGATQYWDVNGAANGFGGTGTWDVGVTANWNDSTGTGTPQVWTNGNDAVFQGAASTTATPILIAAGATVDVGTLTFAGTAGNTQINGGAGAVLNLTNPTSSIVMSTNTNSTNGMIIAAPIGGTDITVMNNYNGATNANARTLLNLNGTNTFTGNLILGGTGVATALSNGNQVSINSAGALPSTATVNFARNFSNLVFTSGGAGGTTAYTATFGNNINLNASGSGTFTSGIGAAQAATVVTLTGVISGDANLVFTLGNAGGQATIILANHETYTGATSMTMASTGSVAGIVRLGVDDALPTGTAFTLGNPSGAPSGVFDMAGHNQAVASLASGATPSGSSIIGGITNTSGTLSTLTISGSASTTYAGPIGVTPVSGPAGLTGQSDNIAVVLGAGNTGTQTFSRAAGTTYSGGTTINGGTLIVANTSGSGAGTGAVTVGSGGKLGSAAISGATAFGTITGHVTSAGTLVPGTAGAVGTLTLSGGLTAQAGSAVNFDFNATANDTVALGGPDDATIFSATGGGVSLNLFDLTGTSFQNGQTYTLFTYPAGAFSASDPTTGLSVVRPVSGTANNATFTLSNDSAGGAIKVTVTGVGSQKTWAGGATGSGTWDVGVTADLAGGATFSNGDAVTFDDTANAGDNPVVVTVAAGGVAPGNTVVNAGARDYTIQGGPIAAGSVIKGGTGTLVLSGVNTYAGGTVVNAGVLEIAGDSSLGAVPASPTVNLTLVKTSTSTGTLRFGADATLNANRTILLNQSNGGGPAVDTNGHNVTIAGQMTGLVNVNLVKQGAGTLTLTGDNSTSSGGGFINALLVNGGTLNVSQDVSLGQLTKNVTLNGGTLQFGASFNPAGRGFVISSGGGRVDTNGFNATIDGVVSSSGTLTKVGAGTLTLGGANTLTGATVVNGGSLVLRSAAWAPVLTNAGGADVKAGTLVFDYAGASSPVGTLVPLLKASHDSSNFTDATKQIRTSNTNDPNKGLGYYDDGSSTVKVMYTWYGDANLDGTVNADDYTLMDRSVAKGSSASWVNGDFNYDGLVDSGDYLAMDTSFGKISGQLPAPLLVVREAQFGSQYVADLVAAVPEPASLGLIALAGAAMMVRRRRVMR